MNLTRWNPFQELEDMSARLNRLLTQTPSRSIGDVEAFADWAPAVDVEETEKEYLVKADLPAVKKEDVKVAVENGTLSIEGERTQEKEEKNRKLHRIERSYGKFVRRMAVPNDIDESRIAAEFKDGVLSVHLPKQPNGKSKTIDVKVM